MKLTRSIVYLCVFAIVATAGCGKRSAPKPVHRQPHREKWGYMDKAGRLVIKPLFDEVTAFHEGAAAVRVGRKWGFIDKEGHFIVSPTFLAPSRFSEGVACVETRWTSHDTEYDHSGDWNESIYIDKTGKHLFSFKAICYDFSDGLAAFGIGFNSMVGQPNKWNYVNKTGRVVIKQDFSFVSSFSEGLAAVSPNHGKWGYIDTSGRFVICPPFDSGSDFHEGLAAVFGHGKHGKTGYIDKTGRVVVRPIYDDGGDFHCGRALVLLKDKYGYIDAGGVMRVKSRYDEADEFSDGLAMFRDPLTLKWGFIDINGLVKLKPQYDDAMRFREGLALVRIGDKSGYVDKSGKMVIVRPPGLAYMAYDGENQERLSFSEGLAPFPSAR